MLEVKRRIVNEKERHTERVSETDIDIQKQLIETDDKDRQTEVDDRDRQRDGRRSIQRETHKE